MKINELINILITIFLLSLALIPILTYSIVIICRFSATQSIIISSNLFSLNGDCQYKNICWIFSLNRVYQVLVSFYSVIINNPNEKFVFYFIIPEKSKINLKNFIHFLKPGSRIELRYFKPEHAFAPYLKKARYKCHHSPIIVVKVWLSVILPNVDKILFLDSDMINVAPISNVWDFDLNGKTIAGTYRVKKKWINSGFIFYNLNEIRKREGLIECAYQSSCYIDDYWHTKCHVNSSLIVPYRYNVEFGFMINHERDNFPRSLLF